MSCLQNTVTRRYNVRHQAWGRLFGDRYKAIVVDGAEEIVAGLSQKAAELLLEAMAAD